MNEKELIDDIKIELENLERLNEEMKDLLVKIEKEPTFIEIRAAASILHDFYCGVEKIFERIALTVDKNLPSGESWHIELLFQMVKPFANIREPVISENLFQKLKEYLKFRHLFRYIYGFKLEWKRVKGLCIELEVIFRNLESEIEGFLKRFEKNEKVDLYYRATIDKKIMELRKILLDMESVLIAYSGGVDSTLLLKVANDVLKGRCLSVTVRSEAYPKERVEKAVNLARTLCTFRHKVIDMKILDIPGFTDNTENRCYLCKREMFQKLISLAKDEGLRYVIDGTNYDDTSEFRPGIKALEELRVRSPLREACLTKDEIRYVSKELSLPTWNEPPFTCLVSRIPYGTKITRNILWMIDEAERFIHHLGFRQVRVRHYGDLARIELDPAEIKNIFEQGVSDKIIPQLKDLGYNYITLDLEGYRRGSMDIRKGDRIDG